jgi:CheY-like chemotaxis protein
MSLGARAEALPRHPGHESRQSGHADSGSPRGPGAARRPGEESRPAEATSRPDLSGMKVLVVDDDEDSLDYFALALRLHGAVVATASSALDALRLLGAERPDVVLSDIAMIGQDGYWLVGQIRGRSDHTRRIPVVATTAYGREHSRARTLAAGFTEHLVKPVDPDVLCRTIHDVRDRDRDDTA